eukprot:GHVH01000770.1.p1 GENE.GHVH01000770.1~~GHVH01000770.1.p1  ORF type:complete len:1155 (-),score=156.52 GHVH01000770.1:33-3497(-)
MDHLWNQAVGRPASSSRLVHKLWSSYLKGLYRGKVPLITLSEAERRQGVYVLAPDLYTSSPPLDGIYWMNLMNKATDTIDSALSSMITYSPRYYMQYLLERVRTRSDATQTRIGQDSSQKSSEDTVKEDYFGTKEDSDSELDIPDGTALSELDPERLKKIPFENFSGRERKLMGPKQSDLFAATQRYSYLFPVGMKRSKSKQLFVKYSKHRMEFRKAFFGSRRDPGSFRGWYKDESKNQQRHRMKAHNASYYSFKGVLRSSSHLQNHDEDDLLQGKDSRILKRDSREHLLPKFQRKQAPLPGARTAMFQQSWKYSLPYRGYKDTTFGSKYVSRLTKDPIKTNRRQSASAYASIKEVEMGRGKLLDTVSVRPIFEAIMKANLGQRTHNKILEDLYHRRTLQYDRRVSATETFIMTNYLSTFYPGESKINAPSVELEYLHFMTARVYENAFLLSVCQADDSFLRRTQQAQRISSRIVMRPTSNSMRSYDLDVTEMETFVAALETMNLSEHPGEEISLDDPTIEVERLHKEYLSPNNINKKAVRLLASGIDIGGGTMIKSEPESGLGTSVEEVIRTLWTQGILLRFLEVLQPLSPLPNVSHTESTESHADTDETVESADKVSSTSSRGAIISVRYADYLDSIAKVKPGTGLSLSHVAAVLFLVTRESRPGLTISSFMRYFNDIRRQFGSAIFNVLPAWYVMMEPEAYPGQTPFAPSSLIRQDATLIRSAVVRIIDTIGPQIRATLKPVRLDLRLNDVIEELQLNDGSAGSRIVDELVAVVTDLSRDTLNLCFVDLSRLLMNREDRQRVPFIFIALALSISHSWIQDSFLVKGDMMKFLLSVSSSELLDALWYGSAKARWTSRAFKSDGCVRFREKKKVTIKTPQMGPNQTRGFRCWSSSKADNSDSRLDVTSAFIDGYIDSGGGLSSCSAMPVDLLLSASLVVAVRRICINGSSGLHSQFFNNIVCRLEKAVPREHVLTSIEEVRLAGLQHTRGRRLEAPSTSMRATPSSSVWVSDKDRHADHRRKLKSYNDQRLVKCLDTIRNAPKTGREDEPVQQPGVVFPSHHESTCGRHDEGTFANMAPLLESASAYFAVPINLLKSIVFCVETALDTDSPEYQLGKTLMLLSVESSNNDKPLVDLLPTLPIQLVDERLNQIN